MLRKIKIDGYKMFRDFELDFTEGVNLICGPNGSCKSALRELMYSLSRFLAIPEYSENVAWSVSETFPKNVFSRWNKRHLNFSPAIKIHLELNERFILCIYDLTIEYNPKEQESEMLEETLHFQLSKNVPYNILKFKDGVLKINNKINNKLTLSASNKHSGISMGADNSDEIKFFRRLLSEVFSVYLDPRELANDFKKGAKELGANGENFSAWHFYNVTQYNDLEKQQALLNQCKNFIPGLVNVSSPQHGDYYRHKLRVNYENNNYDLELRELSDGQKKLFALYSILTNIPDGATLLIDEPENFLSPSELQPWLDAVNDAWEERNIQFIIITHNPHTLNWYHKEAVIFKIAEEPPRVVAERNNLNSEEELSLYEKLQEMEWSSKNNEQEN